jgi:uncharacterized membrane protein
MTQLVKFFYCLALAVWVGGMILFSFIIAPTVHRTLDAPNAAKLIRRLFPSYYILGIICAGVGIVCVGLLLADRAFGRWPGVLSLLLLAAAGGTTLWLRQSVTPAMNNLREQRAESPTPETEEEWRALHHLSVRLNIAVLVCGLALLFLVLSARVV